MRKLMSTWLTLTLVAGACRSAAPPDATTSPSPSSEPFLLLDGDWMIEGLPPDADASAPGYVPSDPIPARVPGIVQTALLEAGRISDPYLGQENETSQWVTAKSWWYRRTFSVPESFRGRIVRLRLDGAVYASTVWVNGVKAGATEGMHDRAAFDVSAALRYGQSNLIVVRFPPPPPDRVLGEVCQMSYGWDFAPKLIPVGLWGSVSLTAHGPQWIEAPSVETDAVEENGTARLTLRAMLINAEGTPKNVTLHGSVVGTSRTVMLDGSTEPAFARFRETVELPPNAVQDVTVSFRLRNARLWWPNGMGDQPLYQLHLQLDPAGSPASTVFGVRTVRFVKNEGAAEKDLPWTFIVNGRRTFITGVNWVPVDSLYRLDLWRYERLLRMARDSGVKLVRVWGGGILETDGFYNRCDQLGLMVWQEFPLSVSEDYSKIPRRSFLSNAADQVLRLREHPSLVLWNGGNEFNPDHPRQKDLVDGLADVIRRHDPSRPFYRASPYHGEEHDWTVWHGLQPYTEYRRPTGFRSEAGLQSPPVLENLKRFLPADQLWPPQAVHEYRRLMSQTERYTNEYGPPTGLEDWIRKLQLAHAIAAQFNVETCRSKKYRTSGVLPWQWNEPWPCICWSLIDWYGEPKPALDHVRRAFAPLRITADFATYKWSAGDVFRAEVVVVNDLPEPQENLKAVAELVDREGRAFVARVFDVAAGADAVVRPGELSWALPPNPDAVPGRFFFLRLRLEDARGGERSSNVYWHGVEKPRPPGWRQLDLIEGWRIRIDPEDAGLKAGWFKADVDDSAWGFYQAGVPWELQGYQGYDGNGWLRKWVEVPEDWRGGPVLIGFGGVDDAYTLYVNGERAAKHGEYPNNVWNKLTTTDIAKWVKFGERNLIALHIEDWRVDGAIHKLPSRLANNPAAFTTPEYDNLFAGLTALPPAEVRAKADRVPLGGLTERYAVTIENASAAPAFQVGLWAAGVPEGHYAWWSDNHFTLWGGERRTVVLEVLPLESHPGAKAAAGPVRIRLGGWNVKECEIGR